MSIKKHIPARKRSFKVRMGGVLKRVRGQKTLSPAYWSIQAWKKGFKNMIDKYIYKFLDLLDKIYEFFDKIFFPKLRRKRNDILKL